MTKKRLLLIASVPLTIAVALGGLAMLPPSPGVTKANFDRIEKGMTLAEVEEIFGGKGKLWAGMAEEQMGERWVHWTGDDGSGAVIGFLGDCVFHKQWSNSQDTFLDKIRRWLHLP